MTGKTPPVSRGETDAFIGSGYWDLDPFTRGYLQAMVFTEAPDGSYAAGHEFGDLDAASVWQRLDLKSQGVIVLVCRDFQDKNKFSLPGYPDERAGMDFWFSRKRAGVGFWEVDFGTEEQCAALQSAAEEYGDCAYLHFSDENPSLDYDDSWDWEKRCVVS